MKPFFFGDNGKQLYGIYHEPQQFVNHNKAALLCPPIGYQYYMTHWGLQRLAVALASVDVPTLRFDFYGTGNSAGTMQANSLKRWCQDVELAVQKLKKLSGADEITLVGMQLGAVVAAMCARQLHIDHVLMIDPVLTGKQHIDQLKHAHRNLEREYDDIYLHNRDYKSDQYQELVGMAYSFELMNELKALNLFDICHDTSSTFSIILTEDNQALDNIKTSLQKINRLRQISLCASCANWPEKLANRQQVTVTKELIDTVKSAIKGAPV